jgi:hypothetical protein
MNLADMDLADYIYIIFGYLSPYDEFQKTTFQEFMNKIYNTRIAQGNLFKPCWEISSAWAAFQIHTQKIANPHT